MKIGLILLKGDLELAKEEVLSILNHPPYELYENLLVVESTIEESYALKERLGLSSSLHSILFSSPIKDLDEKMRVYDWKLIYNEDFSMRIHHLKYVKMQQGKKDPKVPEKVPKIEKGLSESSLAGFVWIGVSTPKVKLRNSKTQINVFLCNDFAICTLLLFNVHDHFEKRKSHLRSFTYSGSMHPRLARAVVNLTGAKEGDTLMDPCCGSGGMLIEAGLCKLKAEGYDINRNMVWGTMRNMAQQKLLDYSVTCKDALTLEGKWDYVATDLPYGMNTNAVSEKKRISIKNQEFGKKNLQGFYEKFFEKLRGILGKKAVIVLPHFVDGNKLASDSNLNVEKEFSQYVHGSLTRKIFVLTKE